MKEERAKKEEVFGKLGPVSSAEYLKIYKETGIDIDGRSEKIQEAMDVMGPVVKKLVALYHCLPGFTSLPIEDKEAIFKGDFSHFSKGPNTWHLVIKHIFSDLQNGNNFQFCFLDFGLFLWRLQRTV